MKYQATIGLEVHVQLQTRSKLFCGCPVAFGEQPNQNICPICVGWPGTLPSLNGSAVEQGVRLALSLGATLQTPSFFSRKHYFYGDLPKGYQITQFDVPLAKGGSLSTESSQVALERLHIEEDAGKILHQKNGKGSLVDLNRAGVPLIEVVTTPCMTDPDEAVAFAKGLNRLVRHLGVSDGDMSQGSFRMDANISLCKPGEAKGPRVEIKNLNSFRFLKRALSHEIKRQSALLDRGEPPVSETRGYDSQGNKTISQRRKEGAKGYLYMPEPDLRPLILGEGWLEKVKASQPECPWELESRLVKQYGLTQKQAWLLAEDPKLAVYFETSNRWARSPVQLTVKVILTDLLALYPLSGWSELGCPIPPEKLGILIAEVGQGRLTREAMKYVMGLFKTGDANIMQTIKDEGLARRHNTGLIERLVKETLQSHPKEVDDLLRGNVRVFGFLMGKIMASSQGRFDGQTVKKMLETALKTMKDKGET